MHAQTVCTRPSPRFWEGPGYEVELTRRTAPCRRNGLVSTAHKKDCPMNSRHRYPGRTLFPPLGGDVGTSPVPDGGLEPPGDEAAPRERGNALRAKKKKVEKMKVGDYVCIHSGLLGERHLPCHIVRDLGNHYQLYCPKGVLTNSFSGSELVVPPSKCAD